MGKDFYPSLVSVIWKKSLDCDTLIYGGWIPHLSFKIEIKFFNNKSSFIVKYFDFKICNFRK
ncbi:MAG: hypothetical protein CL841_08000 [Crocinitomicaceae bacterium]|nr:hypothetical protein [Crocinitomicaceae bacterium]